MCAEPHNSNRKHVHDHHHSRHHKCHDAVCKKHGFRQIAVRIVKTLLLFFLPAERPDDRKSCQDFTRHEVDAVHQFLHQLKTRHRNRHQNHHISQNYKHCKHNDPAHTGTGLQYL